MSHMLVLEAIDCVLELASGPITNSTTGDRVVYLSLWTILFRHGCNLPDQDFS